MSLLSDWIEKNRNNPDREFAVRNYTMNKEMYERDFEQALKDGAIVICQYCGYPEIPSLSMEGDSFIKNQCCFSCWYWLHNLGFANGTPRASVIVNGTHYRNGGNQDNPSNKSWLGFGGAVWRFRKIGSDVVEETNNMWHQGTIPQWLKDRGVVDTHEFLDQEGNVQ